MSNIVQYRKLSVTQKRQSTISEALSQTSNTDIRGSSVNSQKSNCTSKSTETALSQPIVGTAFNQFEDLVWFQEKEVQHVPELKKDARDFVCQQFLKNIPYKTKMQQKTVAKHQRDTVVSSLTKKNWLDILYQIQPYLDDLLFNKFIVRRKIYGNKNHKKTFGELPIWNIHWNDPGVGREVRDYPYDCFDLLTRWKNSMSDIPVFCSELLAYQMKYTTALLFEDITDFTLNEKVSYFEKKQLNIFDCEFGQVDNAGPKQEKEEEIFEDKIVEQKFHKEFEMLDTLEKPAQRSCFVNNSDGLDIDGQITEITDREKRIEKNLVISQLGKPLPKLGFIFKESKSVGMSSKSNMIALPFDDFKLYSGPNGLYSGPGGSITLEKSRKLGYKSISKVERFDNTPCFFGKKNGASQLEKFDNKRNLEDQDMKVEEFDEISFGQSKKLKISQN